MTPPGIKPRYLGPLRLGVIILHWNEVIEKIISNNKYFSCETKDFFHHKEADLSSILFTFGCFNSSPGRARIVSQKSKKIIYIKRYKKKTTWN